MIKHEHVAAAQVATEPLYLLSAYLLLLGQILVVVLDLLPPVAE